MREKPPLEERLAYWRHEFGKTDDERAVEVLGVHFPFAPLSSARRTYELDYGEAGVVVHALKAYAQGAAAAARTLTDPTKQAEQFAKGVRALLVAGNVQAKFQAPKDPQDDPANVISQPGMTREDALGVELAAFLSWFKGRYGAQYPYTQDTLVLEYLNDRKAEE